MIITQTTTNYVPSRNNKSYPKGGHKGVNMAKIEIIGTSYPNENNLPQGSKVGSGYMAKKGLINVNFAENSETPTGMSLDEIEAHIMGVVLIEHFNMKKGIDIFEDRAKTMKDLQKIHDMNTYKTMYAYTLA